MFRVSEIGCIVSNQDWLSMFFYEFLRTYDKVRERVVDGPEEILKVLFRVLQFGIHFFRTIERHSRGTYDH